MTTLPVGEISALLSAVFFGLSSICIRKGMASGVRAPDDGLFFTNLINAAFFFVLMIVLIVVEGMPTLVWWGIIVFIVAGLLTSYFGRGTYFVALRHLGPSRASGFRVVTPFFTLLVSLFWLGERMGPIGIAGMAVTVVGLYLLSQESTRSAGTRVTVNDEAAAASGDGAAVAARPAARRSTAVGMSMSLFSSICYGAGHTLRKVGLLEIPSPTLGNLIGSLVGLAGVGVQFGSKGELGAVWKANTSPVNWWFVWAGIVMSLAQLAIFAGIFYTKVAIASTLYSTEPAWTLLFSWLFLKREENVTLLTAFAVLMIVIGIVLIVLPES